MHCKIDRAGRECFFNFFDEDAFAVDSAGRCAIGAGHLRGKGGVLHTIARGTDDDDLSGMPQRMQMRCDVIALPECESRAARTNAEVHADIILRRKEDAHPSGEGCPPPYPFCSVCISTKRVARFVHDRQNLCDWRNVCGY